MSGEGLQVAVPAETAARQARVPLGVVRRLTEVGVVAPVRFSDRGVPLYSPVEVERLRRAHALEEALAVTSDLLRRLLDAEDTVAVTAAALADVDDRLQRRTVLATALQEVEDLEARLARVETALGAARLRVAGVAARLRDLPVGR